jgi:glycine/D-amino acid oxidase-like deaminating enzyme
MTDIVVVGGGIMGLWAALVAGRAGLGVAVLERDAIGSGASGGLLGALMPHTPDRWNAKKQFQFDALLALEPAIRRLEGETGLSAGYRRTGRLIPLAKPHLRDIALRQAGEARVNWSAVAEAPGRSLAWEVQDAPPAGLFDAAATVHGAVLDTLAARVSPRGLLAVLEAALAAMPNVTVHAGCGPVAIDPLTGSVVPARGSAITAGEIVLAAGVETFPILDALRRASPSSGSAVKGQAARLAAKLDPAMPILYSDGVYVIAHDDGSVAVGSTSEIAYDAAFSTDGKLDDLLERASSLVPAIAGARVVERWAGLRPKAVGRDPMAGPHPDHPRLHLMAGGFKIGFGIAHHMADAVIGGILGRATVTLPDSFLCARHLAAS